MYPGALWLSDSVFLFLQICNQLEVIVGTKANFGPYGNANSSVLRMYVYS